MKISVLCGDPVFYPALAEYGYAGIDLPVGDRDAILTDEYRDLILGKAKAAHDAGLEVSQIHLPYLPSHMPRIGDGSYRDYEGFILPLVTRGIELCSEIGCRTAVAHIYYEAEREPSVRGNEQLLSKLLPVLEKNRVILSIENIYAAKYTEAYLSAAEDLLYYADLFDDPNIGICLDAGHAVIRGQNVCEMLEKVKHRLTALHLHSTVPNADQHTIPGLVGGVDWLKFTEILKDSPYAGTFNMEIKPPKHFSPRLKSMFYSLAAETAKEYLGQ